VKCQLRRPGSAGRSRPVACATIRASATSDRPKADADAIKQRDQELDATRRKERESAESQAKLRREIESLGDDRRALNKQLIDTAARVRDLEASIDATQARLKPLDEQEARIAQIARRAAHRSSKSSPCCSGSGISRRRSLFVEPEDALQAVRTAITLGAVLPEHARKPTPLAGDLADLPNVRKGIVSEHERLARDLDGLGRDQLRLNLLIDERQKKETASGEALEAERVRAADLARQADSLKNLIAKLESGLPAANPRRSLRPARSVDGDATRPNLAALNDPGRLTPAVAFAATRGPPALAGQRRENPRLRHVRRPRRNPERSFDRRPS
jgi:septal ring factor EnvC (AmiA/AmiB activator)